MIVAGKSPVGCRTPTDVRLHKASAAREHQQVAGGATIGQVAIVRTNVIVGCLRRLAASV